MSAAPRFRITASPKLNSRSEGSIKLEYVEFLATCEGEDARTWRTDPETLVCLFDILDPKDNVPDLICELHEGKAVTLPGDHSSIDLVLLGYRVPLTPPQRAGIPGDLQARHAKATPAADDYSHRMPLPLGNRGGSNGGQ